MYKKETYLIICNQTANSHPKKITDFSCIKKVVLKIRLQNLKIFVNSQCENKNQIDTKAEMRFKRRGGKKDFE